MSLVSTAIDIAIFMCGFMAGMAGMFWSLAREHPEIMAEQVGPRLSKWIEAKNEIHKE